LLPLPQLKLMSAGAVIVGFVVSSISEGGRWSYVVLPQASLTVKITVVAPVAPHPLLAPL
jgi:hypothetical protein